MNLARFGLWKSLALRRFVLRSLVACTALSLVVAITACSDGRDAATSPPPFNGVPGAVGEIPPPPAGVDGAAQDPGSDGLGDVDQGLPLAPTDGAEPAHATPPVEEQPVDETPEEEPPGDPNAPVQCTPNANPGSQSDGDVNIVLDSEFQKITGFGGVTMIRFFSGSTLTPGQVDIAFGMSDDQLSLRILR